LEIQFLTNNKITMKKIYIAVLTMVLALPLTAQQNPQFTHFMFNKLVYNPAYAGNREALSISAIYRNQWSGIDGAPTTINANVHTPFSGKRAGIGMSIVSDQIGMLNTTFANIAYNYSFKVSDNSKLGIGVMGRMEHGRIDWSKADPADIDDQLIFMEATTNWQPNFGFGLYLSGENYYLGVSAPTLLENSLYTDLGYSGEYRSYYAMGAMMFDLSSNVKFKPSAMISYNPNAPLDLDLNASFLLMDALWLGGTWRMGDSFDAIIQYQFTNELRAGMAFDFTTSKLNDYTTGSYEMMIEYTFVTGDEKLQNIRYF